MNPITPLPSELAPAPLPSVVAALHASKPLASIVAPKPVAAAEKAATPVDPAQLKSSVEAINKFLKVNSEVQFSIDDASGKAVIKVIDTESKKILRQFPSEQTLEIGKDLGKLKGLLINSQA